MDYLSLVNHFTNENEILQEKYFGKNPELLKLEKAFAKAAAFMKAKPNEYPMREKFIKDIRDITKNLFGFEDVAIQYTNTYTPTVCTYPVILKDISIAHLDDMYIMDKNGFKINNKYKFKIIVMMSPNIFSAYKLTPKEMTAIYLHEIGHSFQSIMDMGKMSFFTKLQTKYHKYVGDLSETVDPNENPDYFKEVIDGVADDIVEAVDNDKDFKRDSKYYKSQSKKDKKAIIFSLNFTGIMDLLSTPITGILIVANMLAFKNIKNKEYKNNMKNLSKDKHSMKYELFSDSFSAMYGYGADLSSGLHKLAINDIYKRLANEKSLNSFLAGVNILTNISGALSCGIYHPDDITRMQSIISHYRFELDNNKELSESDKEYLMGQIKSVEVTLNDLINKSRDDDSLLRKYAIIANKFAYKYTGVKMEKFLSKFDYDFGIDNNDKIVKESITIEEFLNM